MDARKLEWYERRRTRWELIGLPRGDDVISEALKRAPVRLWYGDRFFMFSKDDSADESTTLCIEEQYRLEQIDGVPHVVSVKTDCFRKTTTVPTVVGEVSPDELRTINAQHVEHEARAFFDNAAHELDGQEQD